MDVEVSIIFDPLFPDTHPVMTTSRVKVRNTIGVRRRDKIGDLSSSHLTIHGFDVPFSNVARLPLHFPSADDVKSSV